MSIAAMLLKTTKRLKCQSEVNFYYEAKNHCFLIFLIMALLFGYFFIKNYLFSGFKNVSKVDNRVLIDSVKLSNEQTLYWFKYEGWLSVNPESFIAVSSDVCNISEKNALVKGSLIKGIEKVRHDSIFVVYSDSLVLLNPSSKYKFMGVDFSYDKKYPRKNVSQEIFVREICNN